MDIPKFKKKVSGFLLEEDGAVTNSTIIKTGAIIGIGMFSGVLISEAVNAGEFDLGKTQVCDPGDGTAESAANCYTHNNGLDVGNEEGSLVSAHNHHYNHGSHASHGSHGSHSSCCLAPGTKILLGDGESLRVIEEIKVGDTVVSFDLEAKDISTSIVEELISPEKEEIYNINNGLLEITEDHPVRIKRAEEYYWSSINPEASRVSYKIGDIEKLRIGDNLVMLKQKKILTTKITSINLIKKRIRTYTFKTNRHHNYFANKILVHNTGGCGGMM